MSMPDHAEHPGSARFLAALADRYDEPTPLSGGGMSDVYVATERELGRRVVIKRIGRHLRGADALARFEREIALTARLQHPHIVPLLHAAEVEGIPYFVMPWVRGESLHDRLRRGPLSVRETVAVLEDVLQALATAHGLGVVHRDIKPGNILLADGAAVVADFGIAKALAGARHAGVGTATPDVTIEGTSLGTPRYMAPEQFAADPDADHRVDLYALGGVAYEMLAGAPPFLETRASDLARAHLAAPPPPLRTRRADVPPRLAALVMACLEKDPDARPRSATEMLRALRAPDLLSAEDAKPPRGRRSGAIASVAAGLSALGGDLVHAWRALTRTPVLFVSALFCLALGIGSTSAVFGAVDRALLRPLPFHEPDRLVSIFRATPRFDRDPFSAPNFLDLTEDPALSGMAAANRFSRLVEVTGRTTAAGVMRASGATFTVLGARAARGRLFATDDDTPTAAKVVVLSDEFWRERLAADPEAIGQDLRIDGEPHAIIGILPARFRIPHGAQLLEADLWVPAHFTEAERRQRSSNFLRTFGRLAPGRDDAAAQLALATRFDSLRRIYPAIGSDDVKVRPMAEEAALAIRAPLLLLLAAAVAVLAIAAINVSSLLLARGIRRQPELAVRSALGATRWQVMRPVFVESLLVAAVGCLLGLGLAWVGLRSIGTLAAQRMPHLTGVGIDLRAVAIAMLLAALAAAAGALAPALQAARAVPADAMRGGRAGGMRRDQHRMLTTLVVVEGALALTLLIGAGLVLKGFARLIASDPGFDPARLLALEVRVAPTDYGANRAAHEFLTPAIAALRQVPGVAAAGAISQLPYREWGWNFYVRYEGQPDENVSARPIVESRNVSIGFFETTGQRLVAGRLLDARDEVRRDEHTTVLVNQTLVRRDFADRDPIGQRFHWDGGFATIVGVVSDVRNFGPYMEPRPEAYWTFAQRHPGASGYAMLVRSTLDDPMALAGSVEGALRRVDPGVAVSRMTPMPEVIAASLGRPRFLLALIGTLAAVALLLALAGLFGMLTYVVEQRRQEFGLRAALGAVPAQLTGFVLRRGATMVGTSIGVGLALAWAVTRLMQSMLYGVQPRDPTVWAIATAAMALVGIVAALAPAWRAGRTTPMVAMRAE